MYCQSRFSLSILSQRVVDLVIDRRIHVQEVALWTEVLKDLLEETDTLLMTLRPAILSVMEAI
jgi:hypothetical protein